MSNLSQRLLTALVAIPVLIYIFWLGGPWMLGLILLVNLIGLDEFFGILESKGLIPLRIPGFISGTALVTIASVSNEYYMTIALVFAILLVMMTQLGKKEINTAISGISVTLFGLVYVSFLLAHILLMRKILTLIQTQYGGEMAQQITGWSVDLGFYLMILVLGVTFLNDTGAYFVGRFMGKRKLAPVISPKKTQEGAVGGVCTSALGAILIGLVFNSPFPWYWEMALGFILGIAGTVGDLSVSLVKRDADIKDSGTIIPGHGGLLDRLDSILFTFPVAYYCVKIYLYFQLHSLWELYPKFLFN